MSLPQGRPARGKMPRRILILSASSGAGHVRAAQALEKAFAARGDCAVQHIDALDYVSKGCPFSTLYFPLAASPRSEAEEKYRMVSSCAVTLY